MHLPVTNISPTLLALTPEEAHMYEVFGNPDVPDDPDNERARYMSDMGYAVSYTHLTLPTILLV